MNNNNKQEEILALLASPAVDLWSLRAKALSEGGFLEDSIRQKVWPLLVGLHSEQELVKLQNKKIVTACVDTATIELDVTRCTWHLLTGNQRLQRLQMEHKRHKKVAKLIKKKQTRLGQLIAMTLSRSYGITEPEKLRYYQGYHDIACIILCTLGGSGITGPWRSSLRQWSTTSPGMDLSSAVLLQLSTTHFREYMHEDFRPLQKMLDLSFYPLLALWDRPVHDHLIETGMSSWFALPWIITWFAHDMRDTAMVKRIFDFLLVSHPLMPVYLSLAMMLHPYNRNAILATEMDLGCLHQVMSALPRNTSRVGYKYNPGAGYVSDEGTTTGETEATTTTAADDDTWAPFEETDVSVWVDLGDEPQPGNVDTTTSSTVSPISVENRSLSSSERGGGSAATSDCEVPLQELVDNAVGLMQKLPPRQIMGLATRYHGPTEIQRLLGPDRTIPACLKSNFPASSWCLAPRAPSQVGGSAKKSQALLASDMLQKDPAIVRRIVKEHALDKAVIASGYGMSRRDQRTKRKRRNRTIAIAVAVNLCLLAVAWYAITSTTTVTTRTRALSNMKTYLGQILSNSLFYHNMLVAFMLTTLAMWASRYFLLRK